MNFITKDSWVRKERKSWFRRDTDEGKPRYDLIPTDCLKRLAELYMRWAVKYWDNNRRLAEEKDAIDRFKASAFRHFMQRMDWERDEDHWMAIAFNVFAYEHLTNRHKTVDNWEVEKPSEETLYQRLLKERYIIKEASDKEKLTSELLRTIYCLAIPIIYNDMSIPVISVTTVLENKSFTEFIVPKEEVPESIFVELIWCTCRQEWYYVRDIENIIYNLWQFD